MKVRTVSILYGCTIVRLCFSNLCQFTSKNVIQDHQFIGLQVKNAKINTILECIKFCLGRENISFKASLCDNTCYCYQNSDGVISNNKCKSVEYEYANAINNCFDIYRCYSVGNGIYTITVKGKPMEVYCDMNRGGWTVIHRRMNGSVNFTRSYSDYQSGFGSLSGEHWLGLDNIHAIVSSGLYDVRFDMEDFNGIEQYAEYSDFGVSNSTFNYKLQISGYTGNAKNRMSYHNKHEFSTFDVDNDSWTSGSCANMARGGWWYGNCFTVNLNGVYNSTTKLNLFAWTFNPNLPLFIALKSASVKIRPKH